MSFLMIALGSYGFPKKLEFPSTSKLAFAILCQMIGFRLSNPELSTTHRDVRVQGHHHVAAELASRKAYVADHTHQPSPRH